MTQKLVQLGNKSLVAWLHQYMAFVARVLMYSRGRAPRAYNYYVYVVNNNLTSVQLPV